MEGHLSAVAVGSARTELSANTRLMGRFFEQGVPADDDNAYPQCDASAEGEEALQAEFYETAETTNREVGSTWARATPDGFRQFTRDVRSAARTLRDSGLCPRCSDRATASMRLPHASFCGECCFAVAVLGDKR